MINIIVRLVCGALTGVLMTLIIHRRRSFLVLNTVVGGIGTLLFGYLLLPLLHLETTSFNLPGLGISLAAGIVLLAGINIKYREHTMKDDVIKREWGQIHGKIHARWGKITTADADQINGDHGRFITVLQERYGFSEVESEVQLQGFLKAVVHLAKSRNS